MTIDVKNVFLFLPRFLKFFFYFVQRFFIENPIKGFVKHFWGHIKKLIRHSDVVYLVSPNVLNKKFCKVVYLVTLVSLMI